MQIREMLAKTLVVGAIVAAPVLAATPAMAGEEENGHGHNGHGHDNGYGPDFELEAGEWNSYKVYGHIKVQIDAEAGYEFEGGDFEFASIDF